jgi:phosphate:Na+ symporter
MILGGLGLFFAGTEMLTGNLRHLASRQIQEKIARVAASIPAALMWGAVLGAVTQSTQIVTFILVGLLAARMIDARRALPMILGANIGGSLIVFVVTLDIEIVVLLALGVTGIMMTVQRFEAWQSLLRAIFGLGLLYYGLVLLKMGAAPIAEAAFFEDLMQGAGRSALIALAVGAALTVLCQSSTTVTLLAIAFATSGLFSFEQSVMVVYGSNLGSSFVSWLLSGQIRGTERQIAMYQVAFNVFGCMVLVPLFYLELGLGLPLLMAGAQALTSDIGLQLAFICLFFDAISALLLLPLIGVSERLLARFYPPTEQEDDSRLTYLTTQVSATPEVALIMVEREQLRLVQRLPRYIALARTGDSIQRDRKLASLRAAFASVHQQTGSHIEDLVAARFVAQTPKRIHQIVDRHSRLGALEALLVEFATIAPMLQGSTAVDDIRIALVEGLDAVLLAVVGAMESGDPVDLAFIHQITGDRGALMDGVRQRFLSDATAQLGREEKLALLQLTGLLERLIWMLREIAQKAPLDLQRDELMSRTA